MQKTILFVLPIILLLSCSSELNEEGIVGTWKITSFETNAELSPLLIASAREMALSSEYKFTEDHTFTLTDSYKPEGSTGVWNINDEKDKIELTFDGSESGKPSAFVVQEFDSNKMIWIEELGDLGTCTYTLEK